MVPKVVVDAGYTAVGLGVLAIQQAQTRRRAVQAQLEAQTGAARERVEAVVGQARSLVSPLAGPLERLPRLPGPLGPVLAGGRDLLVRALRSGPAPATSSPAAG